MSSEITGEVYAFVERYIEEHGYAPSLREIAAGCYLGTSSVLRHLDKLEALGWIAREPGRARSLTLLRKIERVPSQP